MTVLERKQIADMTHAEMVTAMRVNDSTQMRNPSDSQAAREARVLNRELWAEAQRRGLSQRQCGY